MYSADRASGTIGWHFACHGCVPVFQLWRGEPEPPSVGDLADRAGVARAPRPGDHFLSRGPRPGKSGGPVCVEYAEPAPHARKLGCLGRGTLLGVKEVRVVEIPAGTRRWLPAQFGICIRSASVIEPGSDCWVNVSRAKVRFAELLVPEANA